PPADPGAAGAVAGRVDRPGPGDRPAGGDGGGERRGRRRRRWRGLSHDREEMAGTACADAAGDRPRADERPQRAPRRRGDLTETGGKTISTAVRAGPFGPAWLSCDPRKCRSFRTFLSSGQPEEEGAYRNELKGKR